MNGGCCQQKKQGWQVGNLVFKCRPEADDEPDRAAHDQQATDQFTPANVFVFHKGI